MKTFYTKTIQLCLVAFITGFAMDSMAQCVSTASAGTSCAPRSGFYFGELLPNAGCDTWSTTSPYNPGTYFRMPILEGGCYTVSTCGSSIDTQMEFYEGAEMNTPFLNRDDNGPDCSGLQSSAGFTSTFTDYVRVDVSEFNCSPGGSSSITVKVRQNNNLSITSSGGAMCEGSTRALTATPTPVLATPQPNSGNTGTFSGVGVSGSVFTAPTPLGATGVYTITYSFGYCTTTQNITVYKNPAGSAGADQTVCASTTTMAASATVGTGAWSILSGAGSISSSSDPTSGVTGLTMGSPLVAQWLITNGPCVGLADTVVITRSDVVPPSITCPNTQYAAVDSFCVNTLADYTGLASASDDCGTPTVTQLPAPGTSISGETTVSLIATDGVGNADTCTFQLLLAPTITHFTSRTDSQWRVNWDYSASTPNDTNFRIRYWEQGFPAAFTDHSQFPTSFQKKVTGLDANTWYDVKVGFACADGNFIWGNTESVRTKKVVCPTPANNAQDLPLMENMATVSWDDQGATAYKFRFRQVGSSDWNYSTVSSATKTMNGLTGATTYEYQLKALCTTGLWSSYTSVAQCSTAAPIGGGVESFRLSQESEEFSMEMYPNPNNGQFTIDLNGKISNTIIEIRDVRGSIIRSIDLGDSDIARLDLTDVAPGIYQVAALQNGNRLSTQKLVIE